MKTYEAKVFIVVEADNAVHAEDLVEHMLNLGHSGANENEFSFRARVVSSALDGIHQVDAGEPK